MRHGRQRRLAWHDWRPLAAAAAAQIVLGAGVRVAPVRSLVRSISPLRAPARRFASTDDDRMAWAIEAAGRRLPRISTCLVRALAADLFLSAPDRMGRVRIGIRRSADGTLQSHAWFERDGRIVVGGAAAASYVDFMTLDAGVSDCP